MNETTLQAIRDHAERDYPRESCGLVVVDRGKERYLPCPNVAGNTQHFILPAEAYARAQDIGEIIAVVHSHPDTPPKPSEADKVMCEQSQLPWIIVRVDRGPKAGEVFQFEPSGYAAPLVGRTYTFGVLDCYTLIRDYYRTEFNIELPEFERAEGFWERGEDLYMENFAKAGFAPIRGPVKKGDVFLMQIRSKVVNHGAVYIGDGLILQHLMNRLSSRDVYSGSWQECTRLVVRHKDMPK
jgi:proteasome lid subunit RPN8/RPN11